MRTRTRRPRPFSIRSRAGLSIKFVLIIGVGIYAALNGNAWPSITWIGISVFVVAIIASIVYDMRSGA